MIEKMHPKLAQGCGIFNSHFDRRLRKRHYSRCPVTKRRNGHGMGDAHFTAVEISKVSTSTIAGNVEKGDGNHGMLGKNVGIIKL